MNMKSNIAVAKLGKLRSNLAISEAEGFKGKLNQAGINMVDLMMWLVIAALLLAAALQGIGYYQTAAWTYQAKSDVASVRTFMEAQYTLNNNTYPTDSDLQSAITAGDLKLTGDNSAAVVGTPTQSEWTAYVESASLADAGEAEFFVIGSVDDADATNGDQSTNSPKAQVTAPTVPAP